MMTPSDHISHDLSYFSGPRTSGAENHGKVPLVAMIVALTCKAILLGLSTGGLWEVTDV